MSKPETVGDLAKKLSLEAEGLLAPFGLPSGDKYKDCMKNLVDYTIEALTDWLNEQYNKPIDECLELLKAVDGYANNGNTFECAETDFDTYIESIEKLRSELEAMKEQT